MASPTDIRKGKVIKHQNAPQVVLDMQHRTQGRQAGFVQVTLRNLSTGATCTHKYRSTDNVDFYHTDSQKLEFSYHDQEGFHFMDPETFEDMVLPDDLIAEQSKYLVGNNAYDILFIEGKAIQLQLPAAVEMRISDAPEGIKGDSASNVQKPVTTESGLSVQVPLFIKKDEIIRVSTEDGSYLGRA